MDVADVPKVVVGMGSTARSTMRMRLLCRIRDRSPLESPSIAQDFHTLIRTLGGASVLLPLLV